MSNSSNRETTHAKHNEEQVAKGRRKQADGQRATQQGSHENKVGQSQQGSDKGEEREQSGHQGGKA